MEYRYYEYFIVLQQPVLPPVEGDGNNNQDNGECLPPDEWD